MMQKAKGKMPMKGMPMKDDKGMKEKHDAKHPEKSGKGKQSCQMYSC